LTTIWGWGWGWGWVQVRCMASVLLMVGRGEEQPSIVQTLLDLERSPRKPQYSRASGVLQVAK
jgi:tRNA pseudouridine38/39 synthase